MGPEIRPNKRIDYLYICPTCKKDVDPGETYCPHCGIDMRSERKRQVDSLLSAMKKVALEENKRPYRINNQVDYSSLRGFVVGIIILVGLYYLLSLLSTTFADVIGIIGVIILYIISPPVIRVPYRSGFNVKGIIFTVVIVVIVLFLLVKCSG